MASIRRGYSDDFVIKNNKVGIGASNPQEALDVVGGALQGQDLKVTGVSTQTGFSGFLRADHQIAENIEFSNINVSSLSGEIIVGTGVTVTIARVGLGTTMVGVGTLTTENTIDTTDITTAGGSQIDALKVYNTFTPPSGDTNQRPYAPKPGEFYYNYDFKTIEFFDGNGWRQVDNTTRSGKAVKSGNWPGTGTDATMETFNIHTIGNTTVFGELSSARIMLGGCSSSTRGLFCGGSPGGAPTFSEIDYVTIASEGNAIDFGSLSVSRRNCGSFSSSTRGVTVGGTNPSPGNQTRIDFVEISTLGNAVNFGDLVTAGRTNQTCLSSPTRGFNLKSGGPATPAIEMTTISTGGTAVDFGEQLFSGGYCAGLANSVRGVWGGRSGAAGVASANIQYITMASTGNSQYFGDLTSARGNACGLASQTRGVFSGGGHSPAETNTIEYITISSAGNAQDFGDQITIGGLAAGFTDSHGGLGGF